MRRIIAYALAIIYTSLLWAAGEPSITQSTIGNGLESQTLNVLAKDRLGRLWVGSDVGISLISNGTVTNIKEIGMKRKYEYVPITKDEKGVSRGGRYFPLTVNALAILDEMRRMQGPRANSLNGLKLLGAEIYQHTILDARCFKIVYELCLMSCI